MTTIRSHYIDGPRGQLHLRELAAADEASARPLLCLHPAPTSGLYFTTAMPMLNERRRVLAADYPGYGGSDRAGESPSIADYAQAMLAVARWAGAPVDVLGFHTGCLVAAEMSLMDADSCRRLVLCDIPYFTGERQRALRDKMSVPLPVTAELESLSSAWKFNVASRIDSVPLERALELFAEHLRAGRGDAAGFRAAFSYDCDTRLPALSADVVALATQSGLHDATLAAAEVIPECRLVDVTEVSTAVFESSAAAICRRILAALDDDR